ncbi:MAG: VTT domain-containing protein [bacterium]|nr:MAG: VTT domain-containing protein [bacterium]
MVDFILNFDKYLEQIISLYGNWTLLLLFVIIFFETGLVITPFLPGDSLLFATGTLAATGILDYSVLIILMSTAAILGDSLNYSLGYAVNRHPHLIHNRFIRSEHIRRTEKFYQRHGGKTIILARFIPIIRTFAPFVAGVAKMSYRKFLFYNIIGGVIWVTGFVLLGYFFGNIPVIKNNFSLSILAIIIFSLLPFLNGYLRKNKYKRTTNIST